MAANAGQAKKRTTSTDRGFGGRVGGRERRAPMEFPRWLGLWYTSPTSTSHMGHGRALQSSGAIILRRTQLREEYEREWEAV